jgi:plasmid stabilization system protein ParE
MSYRLRIARLAQQDIDGLAAYLGSYSERFAIEHIDRLNQILSVNIGESPLTWGYFAFSGAPFRAYLFRIGRRTQYWIVYSVDEEARTVDIVRLWNASRDPDALEL